MDIYDKLTGLPNRSEFIKLILQPGADAATEDSWLANIDIDLFIWVNDQFGWAVADQLLIDIRKIILLETHKKNFFPFRVGGDDFTIVGIGIALEQFIQVMQKIQIAVFDQNFSYRCDDPNRDRATVSIGICALPIHKTGNAKELLKWLDDLIYEEKQKNGKAYQAFYAPSL